jgi:hypothetical protein
LPGAHPHAEIAQSLVEADLGRVQLSHRLCEAALGEILGLDLAGPSDQLHRAHRRLVVSVGEHVQMGMGHALAIDLARGLGEAAKAHATFSHERA